MHTTEKMMTEEMTMTTEDMTTEEMTMTTEEMTIVHLRLGFSTDPYF